MPQQIARFVLPCSSQAHPRNSPPSVGDRSMRATLSSAAVLLPTVLGLGCVEQSGGTAPADIFPGPSYNFINGPGSPGPIIMRVAGLPVFLVVNDPQRNLMSIHLNVLDNPICGAGGFDEFDVQRVSTPSVIEAFIAHRDRKSTRLNSSHLVISYAVFCLKKKKKILIET